MLYVFVSTILSTALSLYDQHCTSEHDSPDSRGCRGEWPTVDHIARWVPRTSLCPLPFPVCLPPPISPYTDPTPRLRGIHSCLKRGITTDTDIMLSRRMCLAVSWSSICKEGSSITLELSLHAVSPWQTCWECGDGVSLVKWWTTWRTSLLRLVVGISFLDAASPSSQRWNHFRKRRPGHERCMRLVGWQGEVYAVGCRYTQRFPGLGGTPEDDMIRSSASPPGRWHLFRLPGPIR